VNVSQLDGFKAIAEEFGAQLRLTRAVFLDILPASVTVAGLN
jgi:hypothetical protein